MSRADDICPSGTPARDGRETLAFGLRRTNLFASETAVGRIRIRNGRRRSGTRRLGPRVGCGRRSGGRRCPVDAPGRPRGDPGSARHRRRPVDGPGSRWRRLGDIRCPRSVSLHAGGLGHFRRGWSGAGPLRSDRRGGLGGGDLRCSHGARSGSLRLRCAASRTTRTIRPPAVIAGCPRLGSGDSRCSHGGRSGALRLRCAASRAARTVRPPSVVAGCPGPGIKRPLTIGRRVDHRARLIGRWRLISLSWLGTLRADAGIVDQYRV